MTLTRSTIASARKFRKLVLLLTAVVFLSAGAMAQSSSPEPSASSVTNPRPKAAAEHGTSGEDETAQFKHSSSVQLISRITGLSLDGAYWLAVVVNFAIVAGLIAWFAKKNLPAIFRDRTAAIQKSLEEARKASEDASRRISEIESRLARLDDEINQMRATSEKEAAAEEERIKAAAAEDARRLIQSAEQEIAAAVKAARRELTAYAADLAVSLAAKQIRVDIPTDQMLVRKFGRQLSNDSAPEKN